MEVTNDETAIRRLDLQKHSAGEGLIEEYLALFADHCDG